MRRGIEIINRVRRVVKQIGELRRQDDSPITGVEAMYMTCAQFFADAIELAPVAEQVLAELPNRKLDRVHGKRLLLVGQRTMIWNSRKLWRPWLKENLSVPPS
ncbi:MAG: 2-hydroxyacyl-CoA dehydratase [Desulfomonile tiedjei]|uniref:2-hydroxyacyl-CoA dehydratase n=1 Tax=Desulfomonile tiedjei TaxID=2358 RepID=A0A9D6V152_9BACT|nr:2-hydroxyacyl-CoA dehydratase [Desulfomonile tiedjei]